MDNNSTAAVCPYMSLLSGRKEQRSIDGIAYHRGAALVRLHPTGFCTALIPLLETKKMHQTHKKKTHTHTQTTVSCNALMLRQPDYSLDEFITLKSLEIGETKEKQPVVHTFM